MTDNGGAAADPLISTPRRPSWITRKVSNQEVFTDPDYWPPRNSEFAFDWNEPTFQVYKYNSNDEFAPTFSEARSRLDYSYHSNLVLHRQALQDAILERVVEGTTSSSSSETSDNSEEKEEEKVYSSPCLKGQQQQPQQERTPWIVFTAGAMGVGKGYVLMQLQENNLFSTADFVKIDPDMLKSELPEMAGYLQSDRDSAATKLHRESTQMADVLFEHAVFKQLPVLVDGSLRDVEYYKELFERIHAEFSNYRIAILHVTADHDVIVSRAEKRAEKTGRVVPHDLLNESMRQVPESVSTLSQVADAVVVIANNENKPLELVSLRVKQQQEEAGNGVDTTSSSNGKDDPAENTPSWEDFAALWKDEEAADDAAKASSKSSSKGCRLFRSGNTTTTCRIKMPVCRMSRVFQCSKSQNAANCIWKKSYPHFCARCTLASDQQCGVCVHGKHLCTCTDCNDHALPPI